MTQESKKAGVSLVAFYDLLNAHDWTYQYSDDITVWRRGDIAHAKLSAMSHQSPGHRELWMEFTQYHFSGAAYGIPQREKPKRPCEFLGLEVVENPNLPDGVLAELRTEKQSVYITGDFKATIGEAATIRRQS